MKRPWAFICASEGATSKHLRNYCREVYLLGYLPVCPKLQDSQYLVLEDAMERSEYTAIVRDKLLRCPMLVVCSRNQDATTNAQIGLAQKYNRIVTTLDGLKKAVSDGCPPAGSAGWGKSGINRKSLPSAGFFYTLSSVSGRRP